MRAAAVGTLTALLACGHSEPFTSADQRNDGPFSPVVPVRLTYSPQSDLEPAFSADGRWVLYVAERPGDQDRCVVVIPAGGGTWTHQLCAWELDQGASRDGLAAPAMRADGTLLFTRHSGSPFTITSQEMGLYLGNADSVAAARRLLSLGMRPAGGSATWDDLVDPVWIGDDEVLTLTVRRHLVNLLCRREPHPGPPWTAFCARDDDRVTDRDTIPLGVEFARIRVTPTGATVVWTAPADEAIAWGVDMSSGRLHYIVQRADPRDIEGYHESLADTLYTIDLASGIRTARYGTFGPVFSPMERLHGVASGGSRVFISRSWRDPGTALPNGTYQWGTPLRSDISEVLADGTLRTIAPAISWRWGRIRLSPDGRHLLAEALDRDGGDIYLIEVAP